MPDWLPVACLRWMGLAKEEVILQEKKENIFDLW